VILLSATWKAVSAAVHSGSSMSCTRAARYRLSAGGRFPASARTEAARTGSRREIALCARPRNRYLVREFRL
jgi:hypothetical protein